MSKKPVPLTPAMRKHLEALCEKAQTHGLMLDQGSREDAAKARAEYEAAKLRLERAILAVQKSLRKANAPFRRPKDSHNVY